MRMSSLSTQYVKVPVSAVLEGQPYNPTSDDVSMAFPAVNQAPSVWYSAIWETAVSGGVTTYLACFLVGPQNGGLVLSSGVYLPWVKVADDPEIFIGPASQVLDIY